MSEYSTLVYLRNTCIRPLLSQVIKDHGNCSCIIRGEPERAPNTRDTGSGFICIYIYIYYIYLYVCGVIISMSKELNFESRTWVMVVKHAYVQL